MITIYEKNTGIKKAYLDGCIDKDSVSVTRAVNGETTARFDCVPIQGVNVGELLAVPSYVDIDGDFFDVAYVEQSNSAGIVYSVLCEHVIYRLADRELIQYSHEGEPGEILSEILEGSEFSAGIVEFGGHFTFVETESEHILDHLRRFAAALGARLTYDGFSVNLRNNLRVNRGFTVRLGKNAVSVRKIIDRRKDLIYYQATIADLARSSMYEELQDLEKAVEGDTIRIIDDQLGIDAEQCVITRTYNPVDGDNLSLEIANRLELFTDSFLLLERNALLQGRKYYGVSINKEYGLKIYREDGSSETVFNSDSWHVEVGGRRVLYADYTSNPPKFVFNGEFGADVVIAQEVITQNFYADNGAIANLTVNRLRTDWEKPWRYLSGDTTPLFYLDIHDEQLRFLDAVTDGAATEQYTNLDGQPLYWRDGETGGTMTTEDTGTPVTVYVYQERNPGGWAFESVNEKWGTAYTPVITLGQGDTTGRRKARIYKTGEALRLEYDHSGGETYYIELGENGVKFKPELPGAGGSGMGGHVILDHKPTQTEINEIPDESVVLVYGTENPYVPERTETDSMPEKLGTLYPIKYFFVRKAAEPIAEEEGFSFVIYGDSYILGCELKSYSQALNFTIAWGDGTESFVDSTEESQRTHTYPSEQEWTITVKNYVSGYIRFLDDMKLRRVLTPFPENNERTSFSICFQGCENLTSIPHGLFDKNKKVTSFNATFSGCYKLASIPPGLFAYNSAVTDFAGCFFSCYAITSIPGNLFANCPEATDFSSTFIYCRSLSTIPEELFSNNSKADDFAYCFKWTRNLSNINIAFHPNVLARNTDYSYMYEVQNTSYSHKGLAPELWNIATSTRTSGCFRKNEALTNYSSIPAAWL